MQEAAALKYYSDNYGSYKVLSQGRGALSRGKHSGSDVGIIEVVPADKLDGVREGIESIIETYERVVPPPEAHVSAYGLYTRDIGITSMT